MSSNHKGNIRMKSRTRSPQVIGAALALSLAGIASAQTPATAPAPPAPDWTFSSNVGLFSEYIFRGIAQTAGKPAVQGGFDLAHASGFYVGTWASNVSWLEDFDAYSRSSVEWDFYAGFKHAIGDSDFFYDVGGYYYYYPGSRNPGVANADTFEVYGAIGWKWVSAKLSYATTNYFGTKPTGQDTDGTYYVDVSAAYPVADTGLSLIGHYGFLDVRHDGSGDGMAGYSDWKLGVSYVVPEGIAKGLELGAYYTDNDAKAPFYTDATGYDTSKARGVVYVKKTF
jgi:uncharacterized protein (TIGR02001 family)